MSESVTISKTFEFGPGTSRPFSHYRTLAIPPNNNVGIAVVGLTQDSRFPPTQVVIEVRQASADSVGNTGPDGPRIAVKNVFAPNNMVTFRQTFTSPFGCPNTWRVRIRTVNNQVPSTKISGTIIFVTEREPVTLRMEGGTLNLNPNTTTTRVLTGVTNGHSSRSSIRKTGLFKIKAKWHTDPADLLHFNTVYRLTVSLLRPDGTVAASENGFSQHAVASKTPKVDFQHMATSHDIDTTGAWRLRISNNSVVRIVDFDINRGLDPNPSMPDFKSIFIPTGC